MACSDKLVEVPRKERRVKGKEFAREIDATREALVVVVEALEAKNNGCCGGCSRVDTWKEEIQTERAVVAALVEALCVKTRKEAEMETGKEAVAIEDKKNQAEMETGKEAVPIEEDKKNQAEMDTGKEAAAIEEDKKNKTEMETGKESVPIDDKNQAKRSLVDRIFDEFKFVDIFEDTVDGEVCKEVVELQEMWHDCVVYAREIGVRFGPPSHPHCAVGWD